MELQNLFYSDYEAKTFNKEFNDLLIKCYQEPLMYTNGSSDRFDWFVSPSLNNLESVDRVSWCISSLDIIPTTTCDDWKNLLEYIVDKNALRDFISYEYTTSEQISYGNGFTRQNFLSECAAGMGILSTLSSYITENKSSPVFITSEPSNTLLNTDTNYLLYITGIHDYLSEDQILNYFIWFKDKDYKLIVYFLLKIIPDIGLYHEMLQNKSTNLNYFGKQDTLLACENVKLCFDNIEYLYQLCYFNFKNDSNFSLLYNAILIFQNLKPITNVCKFFKIRPNFIPDTRRYKNAQNKSLTDENKSLTDENKSLTESSTLLLAEITDFFTP